MRLVAVCVFPASIDVPQTTMTRGRSRAGGGASAKSPSRNGCPRSSAMAPSRRNFVGSGTAACLLATTPHTPPLESRSQRFPSARA